MGPHQVRVGGRRNSLDLLATLLLMHPRIPLAFLAARAHCWLMVKLLSTSTPRSLSTELYSYDDSMKPILGTSTETCENQAAFNCLLKRNVETEELRLMLKITILFFAVGCISESICFSEDHVT